jgi:hypothetical protein
MDRQITIDDDAGRLVDELTGLTGETVEAAIAQAVRERLERERRVQEDIATMRALAEEVRAHVQPGTTSDTSWLYDESGLPA